MTTHPYCDEYSQLDRRAFLGHSVQAGAGLLFGNTLLSAPRWMPRLRLADPHVGPRGDTLVCVFLRGGADGLNIVAPHGDDVYYQKRPTIAVPRPDDRRVVAAERAIDLDGFFGLHPALAPLHPIYAAGDLVVVHATGSPDETRSHFEAMDLMERGAAADEYTGWLARHLASLDTGNDGALRAIGIGDMVPLTLNGAVSATALRSIADYHLVGEDARVGEMQALLSVLYNRNEDLLTEAANRTFAAIEALDKIDAVNYTPVGRPYPADDFGRGMRTIAQLIKAEVGVEVACIDLGGWDTHVAQGPLLANLLTGLGEGLAAFYEDLPDAVEDVTVVVMSEFGRRVEENGGLGTDHGHGNAMLLLGGGLNGGQVFAQWPGLARQQLTGPGDLAITTDYRDVLGELIGKRLNNPKAAEVFPGYAIRERGVAVKRPLSSRE